MAKILVVDDSTLICSMIKTTLEGEGFEVAFIHTGEEASEAVRTEKPDLILLDVVLPGIDGYTTCRLLMKNPDNEGIPILFITSASDEKFVAEGFSAGCADYIPKPFSTVELVARVKGHIKNKFMTDLLKSANDELERTNKQLTQMLEEKRQWAVRDSMTGLYNRRYFMEQQPCWNQRAEAGAPFCIALLDVDDFKKINDRYGHCAGDYILCTLAQIIGRHCKKLDEVIRWGGEEFLLILPDTDEKSAEAAAEQVRTAIFQYPFVYNDEEITCTVTIGVVKINPAMGVEQNVARADAALYQGKRLGKNCTIINEFVIK